MLKGLSDRPNVQCTLILSRHDGSIIRATGVVALETPSTYTLGDHRQNLPPREAGTETDGRPPERRDSGPQEYSPTPAEVLAASIFQFVTNATSLGTALGSTTRTGSEGDGSAMGGRRLASTSVTKQKAHGGDEDFEGHDADDDEVQLLRLRTKQHEIIIFPDANYICSVVVTVGQHTAPVRKTWE